MLDRIGQKISYEQLIAQKMAVKEFFAEASDNTPAVYVGTYGKYNEGSVFGEWIDITKFDDYDAFIEVCRRLHADEEDPELMIQDYENFPYCWYSESIMDEETFEKIQKYANMDDKSLFDAYYEATGDESIEKCLESYMGDFDSEEDFAEHIINECYDLDRMMGHLKYYFNYEAYAKDLFRDGYVFSDGKVFDTNR